MTAGPHMTAGTNVRPRRSSSNLAPLAPLSDDRQKPLPRIVAAACETPLKDGFPPDVDGWAWHIGAFGAADRGGSVGFGAVDTGAMPFGIPAAQKHVQGAAAGAEVRQSTPAKATRAGWLGLRASNQQSGHHHLERPASVPQDMDSMTGGLHGTERPEQPMRHTGSGWARRVLSQSTPPLASLNGSRERPLDRSASGNLVMADRTSQPGELQLSRERDRCNNSGDVERLSTPGWVPHSSSRLSTPGWVPPSSRGSLASRQSNSRSSSRQHYVGGDRDGARRRQPCPVGGGLGSVTLLGRQRLNRSSGLSLPAAACLDLGKTEPGKFSRPDSPDSEPEQQCKIDDETEIPKGLFDDFMKAGKEARSRGQHTLDKKRPGHPRLVNSEQPAPSLPSSKSSQREARPPSHGSSSSIRGSTFGGLRVRTPQVVTRAIAALEGI